MCVSVYERDRECVFQTMKTIFVIGPAFTRRQITQRSLEQQHTFWLERINNLMFRTFIKLQKRFKIWCYLKVLQWRHLPFKKWNVISERKTEMKWSNSSYCCHVYAWLCLKASIPFEMFKTSSEKRNILMEKYEPKFKA